MSASSVPDPTPPRRRRSLPMVRAGSAPGAARSGSSASYVEDGVGPQSPRDEDSPMARNLAASFPLFFFGGGCAVIAVVLLLEKTHAAVGRIPIWLPFLAIGVIALAGGTLSLFAEPDPKPPTPRPVPRRRTVPPGRPLSRSASDAAPSVPARQDFGRPAPVLRPRPPIDPEADGPVVSQAPAPAVPPAAAPAAPVASSAEPLDSDATAQLAEIDDIDAAIHAGRPVPPAARSAPAVARSGTARAPAGVVPNAPIPVAVGPRSVNAAGSTYAPRTLDHCVGCGSAIVHSGTPIRCQVCGEPLCTDCRDRSLAEGKPNLCPLCGLLDTVHSKGSPTGAPARPTH